MAIKLSPEELSNQGDRMLNLRSEYDSLFNNVSKTLKTVNGNWSEYLSNNFSGKIASAQKRFSAILDTLEFGGNAALTSADTFADIDKTLAKGFDDKAKEEKKKKAEAAKKKNEIKNKMKEETHNLAGEGLDDLLSIVEVIVGILGVGVLSGISGGPIAVVMATIGALIGVVGIGAKALDTIFSLRGDFEALGYLIKAKTAKTAKAKKKYLELAEKARGKCEAGDYIEEFEDYWHLPHIASKGAKYVNKTIQRVGKIVSLITGSKDDK